MTFTDRIDFLLKQKQINASTMLADLNMGGGTLSTWKQRGTIPGGDYVAKIANYLGVSSDYLLGIENSTAISDDGISADKEYLISWIRSSSDEDVAKLRLIVDQVIAARGK